MTSSSNGSDRLRSILVLLATAATIFFNFLAATGRLHGVMTDAVSDAYPTVLTPAGYAFSIWAAIYAGLAGFSICQLLPSKMATFRPIRTLYVASCVLNCVWLWFWHQYQIAACLAVIALLLIILFWINIKSKKPDSFGDAIFGKGVFGLYCGWITAATLVNFVILLVYFGVQISQIAWNVLGALLIAFAGLLAGLVRFKLKNYLFPLAIAWAVTGIAIKQSGNTAIVATAAFCVNFCLVMAISYVMERKSRYA
jgi:hypothetical protein